MGEYARRLSDGLEVKIGTCETMYYARWNQRKDFIYDGTLDNCFWRVPLPSEDRLEVGEFESMLSNATDYYMTCLKDNFRTDSWERRFIVQARTDSGILVNITCPHGGDLPEMPEDSPVRLHYNGKWSPNILCRVAWVKNADEELRIVLQCRGCGTMVSYDWNDISPYLQENELTKRLFFMCVEYYWEKHHKVPDYDIYWENGKGDGFYCRPSKVLDSYNYNILTMRDDGGYGNLIEGDADYVSKFIFKK